MWTNAQRDAARLLLLLFCCVVTCRVTCAQSNIDKESIEEQKKRERLFLCGASDLYVRWNVTFGALQKRAENVTAAAKMMRDNRQLYKNETEAVLLAGDAISKVAHVLSNTSRALNASRGFMDGIERDFFNAFETIKDDPEKYVYGHSNLNGKASSGFAHKSNMLKVATQHGNPNLAAARLYFTEHANRNVRWRFNETHAATRSLPVRLRSGVYVPKQFLHFWENV
ncbi:hypothetical protein TRVL_09035 [Trypanosoma vivax]|nr:hypothetical protein TRVL_09035 [Trypanosoma vivax]